MGRRARRRSESGESRPRLLRPGEQPGAVLKGPPITLTCECGEKRDLPYGERWQCEKCGRIWDTGRIPRDVAVEAVDLVVAQQLRGRREHV